MNGAKNSPPESGSEAGRLFAQYLESLDTDEEQDFDDLCAAHPAQEADLRALRAAWRAEEPEAVPPGRGISFFRRGRETVASPLPGVEPGRVIGDFRLIEVLGSGGMGQVWEAEELTLGRRVALKLVLPGRADPRGLELFAREARAGGRLSHPGIVRVHGFGETDGVNWINQELVEGGWTLRDFIDEMRKAESLPEGYYRRVAQFAIQLADALQAAHDASVIHRDVKPQNVLITPEDQPKLTDFGLARITDESVHSVTGEFAGTYLYMSPEQVTARRMGIDHRTDVFSLGVVLYEMLALQRPFEGDTTHQIAEKIVTWDPPDLHRVRSRIPAELAVICGKALEKRRDDRYATMADLAADLRRHMANEPILARPPGPLRRAQKWMLRHPTRSVAGGFAVAAFAVISVLLALIWRSDKEAQRSLDEVMRLSLSQDYEDLMAEASDLWPAYPDKINELRSWISNAQETKGKLPLLVAKRDELRRDATPQTEEERRAERESHPEFGRLTPLRTEIEAKKGALAVRRGEAEPERPKVSWSDYPEDAGGLNGLAWELVRPDRETFGQEALGLVLATRAAELAPEAKKVGILDSVAWGQFAVGDDEAALEASREALDAAREEEREEYAGYLASLEAAVSAATSAEGLLAAERAIAERESSLAELEARVDERRSWTFPEEGEEETDARWWHNQLTGLIGELESLEAPDTGLLTEDGVSAEQGWSVARRVAFAERLREGFAEGGEFAARWAGDLPAIRAAYPGLELTVQMGLVPIGPDPESGLWEFWHVQSGTKPLRGEDDKLLLEEGSGLVFVLLSGGRFWMGAQSSDPGGRNYDKDAESNEGPVHEVELSAFFLSKYEMTQGQWERMVGSNPSYYGPSSNVAGHQHDLTHPVEQVSWSDCMGLLPKLGLALPSESQWEYGARGGTDTVWWTGSDRESLRTLGAANLADQAAARAGATFSAIKDWPELDDGFAVHAPADEYAANGYGLHNVHGNVWEWCQDGYDSGFYDRSPALDPLSPPEDSATRVSRGGSFYYTAVDARCAYRGNDAPSLAVNNLGLRPARVITE